MKRYGFSLILTLVVLTNAFGRASTVEPELPRIAPEAVLYSGDWHGARVNEAAEVLGLVLSDKQLDYLDRQAVLRGANTRVVLTLAALNPSVTEAGEDAWIQWVDSQITALRSGMGPFSSAVQSLRLKDGKNVRIDLNSLPLGTWALLRSLETNGILAEPETDLSDFVLRYESAFGLLEPERTAGDVAPFLIHPFNAPLSGRGHFDHRYPTVDNAPLPNDDPLMVDYLGRVNQVPYNSHDGDDFWLPVNSRIVSPVSGKITWSDDQGVLISVDGFPGYDVYVGHLSRVDVVNAQSVTQGVTSLGLSGSANNVPHIHLEVRHYGQQTDTMGWFGPGPDPCTSLSSHGSYGGCEASNWLWIDRDPPDPTGDPATLFSDTFSDGDFLGWTVVDALATESAPSDWDVVSAKGSLVLRQNSNIHTQTPPYEGSYVYTGENWWEDYYLRIEVEPDDNDGVFVLFRYQDEENHYRFFMDRERHYRRLEKKVGGIYTTLAEDLGKGFNADWNSIQIALTGNAIRVSLEYEEIFSVNDNTFDRGKIGIGTWACAECYFDNVVVSTNPIDPFADSVTEANIKGGGNEHSDPKQALGRPNGTRSQDYVSVGGPDYWFTVDMGQGEEVIDGPGHDFRIYEIGAVLGGVDEEYRVLAANDPTGPWVYVGEGWSTSEFDLAGTDLVSARYILIKDLSTRTGDPVPGSDIDAVQALHMAGSVLLPPPENVTLSGTAGSVTITWDPIDRAVAYNVYYGLSGSSVGYTAIATVGADNTDYTYTGQQSEELFFRITSIGPDGYESGFSASVPYRQFIPLLSRFP